MAESDDLSELDMLAADLGDVGPLAGRFVAAAVTVSARKVKDTWRDKLKGSETLPALPFAVTYDTAVFQGFGITQIKAEVGFDKDRNQGALGNVSEYGTPTVTGRGYGLAALDENKADFDRGIALAAADAAQAVLDTSSVTRVAGTLARGGKLGNR
jgi:hypothetical protein